MILCLAPSQHIYIALTAIFHFCFLQVNQQKGVEMVSTNNIIYPEQIYKRLVEIIPHCVFDSEEKVGRCSILNNYFIKLKKASSTRGFYKNAVLKNFPIFMGKLPYENTYFEEHLHTAASELTL